MTGSSICRLSVREPKKTRSKQCGDTEKYPRINHKVLLASTVCDLPFPVSEFLIARYWSASFNASRHDIDDDCPRMKAAGRRGGGGGGTIGPSGQAACEAGDKMARWILLWISPWLKVIGSSLQIQYTRLGILKLALKVERRMTKSSA